MSRAEFYQEENDRHASLMVAWASVRSISVIIQIGYDQSGDVACVECKLKHDFASFLNHVDVDHPSFHFAHGMLTLRKLIYTPFDIQHDRTVHGL